MQENKSVMRIKTQINQHFQDKTEYIPVKPSNCYTKKETIRIDLHLILQNREDCIDRRQKMIYNFDIRRGENKEQFL